MAVYIIRAGDTDKVKIGWAEDVELRKRDLQCAHYEELRILRVIPGARDVERWMHVHFRAQQVRGEWFALVPEMLAVEAGSLPTLGVNDPGMRAIRSVKGMMVRVAKGTGKTRSAIAQWHRVPGELLPDVERITGIPRHLLRPDICLPPAAKAAA